MADDKVRGRLLAVDPIATSASPTEPAFLAKPAGSPVYYGFPILHNVSIEGFTFGKITDFEAESCTEGDAFVVALDNSRAGLVWEIADIYRFEEIIPLKRERWGVWDVSFPHAMDSLENVRKNLATILPDLKLQWERWRHKFPRG